MRNQLDYLGAGSNLTWFRLRPKLTGFCAGVKLTFLCAGRKSLIFSAIIELDFFFEWVVENDFI